MSAKLGVHVLFNWQVLFKFIALLFLLAGLCGEFKYGKQQNLSLRSAVLHDRGKAKILVLMSVEYAWTYLSYEICTFSLCGHPITFFFFRLSISRLLCLIPRGHFFKFVRASPTVA